MRILSLMKFGSSMMVAQMVLGRLLKHLNAQDPNVKAIKFRRNYGKSGALNVGFEAVQGDVVITMDADLTG